MKALRGVVDICSTARTLEDELEMLIILAPDALTSRVTLASEEAGTLKDVIVTMNNCKEIASEAQNWKAILKEALLRRGNCCRISTCSLWNFCARQIGPLEQAH